MLPASPCPRRVLYVEDDRVAALLFTEALRQAAWLSVDIAETGAEALALAAQWQPEVLVLDAHLPDTTCAPLLLRLRALPGLADVPAFLCSADVPAADDPERQGFRGCWTKPVQRDQLLADLSELLAGPSNTAGPAPAAAA